MMLVKGKKKIPLSSQAFQNLGEGRENEWHFSVSVIMTHQKKSLLLMVSISNSNYKEYSFWLPFDRGQIFYWRGVQTTVYQKECRHQKSI